MVNLRAISLLNSKSVKNLLLVANIVLFIIAINAPLMTISKFYIFDNTVTVMSAMMQLLDDGQWVLFLVLGVFSLLFPVAKLAFIFLAINREMTTPWLKKAQKICKQIGQWSMLDVFVVALLLVTVKLGALVNVSVHMGVYAFLLSVLLTMVLSHWADRSGT